MGREKKKGTSGNVKAFISREKALKKLQLSLQEFRRLCILKGIYPRDPRKKFEGSDKTYYLRKDIDFLAHERLIGTIRQQNSHRKKVVKARSKRRIDILKRLALSAPKTRLDHLVLERYPNFVDAIRELDDPLCIVALFANLPADHNVGIAPERVSRCQCLLREFHNYVAHTNSLRRVFVSIKGYYFQADIMGESVTWITPHRFSQILPADVDYSVMLTFLELYECIMSFVNFRLYTSQNLAYPPKILRPADAKALELSSLVVEKTAKSDVDRRQGQGDGDKDEPNQLPAETVKIAEKLAMEAKNEEDDDDYEFDDEAPGNDPDMADGDESSSQAGRSGVFNGKSVVLGREVPYAELEFCLRAAGAEKVSREDDLTDTENRLSGYTHWIIDRPRVSGNRDMSLEYVQPQYVFDSINAGLLLPPSLYTPGAPLPPHLSPFVSEEDDGGYRPWFKDIIERIKAGDTSVVEEAAAVVYTEEAAKYDKTGDRKKKRTSEENNRRNEAVKDSQEVHNSSAANTKEVVDKDLEMEIENSSHDTAEETVAKELDNRIDDGSAQGADKKDEEPEDDEDEEGEEEKISKSNSERMDKEGRDMATLMLSRKKMRQYQKHKRMEDHKLATRDKLTQKRKRLEAARAEREANKAKRKRQ